MYANVLDKTRSETHGPSNMNPRKIFVHFGTHKTGTSSIQLTLYRNSDKLTKHKLISFGVVNPSIILSRIFRGYGIELEERQRLKRQLHDELEALDGRIGIISAEVISAFSKTEMQEFHCFLMERKFSINYIGYVRNPVPYFKAMLQQTLKQNAVDLQNIDGWLLGMPREATYYGRLDFLHEISGQPPSMIHFHPDALEEEDVVVDFLGRIGVERKDINIYRANDSLPFAAIKGLYHLRANLMPEDNKSIDGKVRIMSFLSRLRELPHENWDLAKEVMSQIFEKHSDFSEWGARKLENFQPVPLSKTSIERAATHLDLGKISDADLYSFGDWAKYPCGCLDLTAMDATERSNFIAQCVYSVRLGRCMIL